MFHVLVLLLDTAIASLVPNKLLVPSPLYILTFAVAALVLEAFTLMVAKVPLPQALNTCPIVPEWLPVPALPFTLVLIVHDCAFISVTPIVIKAKRKNLRNGTTLIICMFF